MSEDIPSSIWSGTFNFFGIDVVCHVLSDGQRVIEQDSMHKIRAWLEGESTNNNIHGDIAEFAAFIRGNGVPVNNG